MSDWRDSDDDEGIKRWLLIGVGMCVAVMAWMYIARPSDEVLSSRGFDLGAAAPSGSSGGIFERRKQTGLSYVGGSFDSKSSSVRPDNLTGAAAARDVASAGAASAVFTPTPSDPADMAPADGEADPARLAALGVPTNKAALASMVSREGLLSKLVDKVLGYPPAVKFLLNNKTVVNGFFARKETSALCKNGSALKSYMMNGSDPKGVSADIAILKGVLRHPESAAAAGSSEFFRRVIECPSATQFLQNPQGLTQVVLGNPGLLGIMADPATIRAISSNPQASALLGSVQSSVGGGRP